jgi:hypothetical protein
MNPFLLLHVTGGVISAFAMIAAGSRSHGLAVPLLVFSLIALLAGSGDRRMIRAGGLHGPARLKRHLWRMCAALFIAAASFFLGPVGRIPVPLRAPVFRLIPLLVLVTLAFWWWRLRRRREWPRVVAGGVPEAV